MRNTVIILAGSLLATLLLAGATWHRTGAPLRSAANEPSQLWSATLEGNADSQPAYARNVVTGHSVKRNLVFVLAGNNKDDCSPDNPMKKATLYALDAATGRIVWTQSTSGPARCTTAGPIVHGSWVYAVGLDGKLHRYRTGNGREDRKGWPVTVTLMPAIEKVSAAPTVGNGRIYVTTSGFVGDQGHYEGHLVAISLSTGKRTVFNSLCSSIHRLLSDQQSASNYCPSVQSGLFGRGQGVIESGSGDVYIVSGNGPWNGHTDWGDSIMKLDPSARHLLDSYTPTNQAELNASDEDLGSTGPALLPDIQEGGKTYRLLVQGGKGPACSSCSGVALRLVNRDNMSGHGGPGYLGGDLADASAPGGCEVLTAPAVYSHKGTVQVYYANGCGLGAYTVSYRAGHFQLLQTWSAGEGGTTPIISNRVLYVARPGAITAYHLPDHTVLWQITGSGQLHWQYPLIEGHRLYISNQASQVIAYKLP